MENKEHPTPLKNLGESTLSSRDSPGKSPKTPKRPQYTVAMIGSGKYAVALTAVMQDNPTYQVNVRFYCRGKEKRDEINEKSTLKSVTTLITFKSSVHATNDIQECLKDADFVFLCIPAQTLSEFLHQNLAYFDQKSIFVNCAKGMALQERKFICQLFQEIMPDRKHKYTTLSGPSFAEEIYKKMPTCVTIAGYDKTSVDELQNLITSPYFKSYYMSDVLGVELCGSLKNVLALGSGFVDGLNFGSNSMAAFVSRGVKEVQILVKHYGADPNTVLSLAGIGDIMMCCYGNLSRNRVCGLRVSKGEKLADVVASIGTVEGVPTITVLKDIIKEKGLETQLMMINGIYDLIYGKVGFIEGVQMIMENRKHHEFEFLIPNADRTFEFNSKSD